jgi:uncharacterized membrane protein
VVTHWNASGQPNGWSSAAFAAFMLPATMAFMTLIFAALPNIDPLKKNYEFDGSVYYKLANVAIGFVAVIQVLLLGTALGWPVDMQRWIPVLMGLLFIYIGRLLPQIRPSWFMGIRTPWTLSSDRVWTATHRVGGHAFVAAGIIFVALAFLPIGGKTLTLMLAVVLPILLWPVVYSYLEWRREKEKAGAN